MTNPNIHQVLPAKCGWFIRGAELLRHLQRMIVSEAIKIKGFRDMIQYCGDGLRDSMAGLLKRNSHKYTALNRTINLAGKAVTMSFLGLLRVFFIIERMSKIVTEKTFSRGVEFYAKEFRELEIH